MTVFIEPFIGGRHLYIFGAGHCGYALARAAAPVGFVIHVFDDRAAVASKERFPMAATITVGDYRKVSAEAAFVPNAFVAIMTHAHAADAEVLANVITKQYAYLGLMASARKKAQIFEHLRGKGIAEQLLSKIHSPIGIDIDAETPEEIAVSIVAELVHVARCAQRSMTT